MRMALPMPLCRTPAQAGVQGGKRDRLFSAALGPHLRGGTPDVTKRHLPEGAR